MKSFKSAQQKKELLAQLNHHQKLDAFVQGSWLKTGDGKIEGNGFKGCFYGCTMQSKENPIEKFSELYQIDLWYCYLTEKIFEGLPKGEFEKFPYESIKIIPAGFNLNKAKSRYFWLLLEDQKRFAGTNKPVLDSIIKCQELFEVDFDQINKSAARSAAESARSADWSAAESAWYAAGSAAESAWYAARSARSSHYIFMRNILFQAINETK